MDVTNKVNFELQKPNILSQTPETLLLKWGNNTGSRCLKHLWLHPTAAFGARGSFSSDAWLKVINIFGKQLAGKLQTFANPAQTLPSEFDPSPESRRGAQPWPPGFAAYLAKDVTDFSHQGG